MNMGIYKSRQNVLIRVNGSRCDCVNLTGENGRPSPDCAVWKGEKTAKGYCHVSEYKNNLRLVKSGKDPRTLIGVIHNRLCQTRF